MCFLLALLCSVRPYYPSASEIEKILANLTLEEKVGQMANIAIDDFIDVETDSVKPDYATLAIGTYKVGSLQNSYSGVAHSRQVWARIQSQLNEYAQNSPAKIPLIYGLDSIHGVTYVANSTLFPQEIGIAATFNTTIAELGSQISAYETRAASVSWVFSPVVDLGLDPRWSRIWEDFGEDPYLSGEMGAAMVRGFQGPNPDAIDLNHVLACVKHYVGYGNPVTGKDRTPAIIPENLLREYHLPSFQKVVESGVATVMVNSALINGVPVHSSHFLLTEILKGELRFEGFVISDWQDVDNIFIRDHVAKSSKDAIRIAVNAGIDMAIVPYDLNFCTWLVELVNEGAVSMERIDDAVRRILRVKAQIGAFEVPVTSPDDYPLFGSPQFEKAALDAASESITLLRNNGSILPLPVGSSVLVTGPNANSMRVLDGGWSYSWQGNAVPQFATAYNTILKAIQNVNGAANVVYEPGVLYNDAGKYWEENIVDIDAVVAAAATVDYVILVLGENSYTEKPGDLQDISLSAAQVQLAKAVIATGKPGILVLSEGRPRVITKFVDGVKAIIQAYLPGNFGGDALANIIFGITNPSGKLPYTYPRYPQGLINYWHKYSEAESEPGTNPFAADWAPLFEFGFGLSYTTFEYSDLTLSSLEITSSDKLGVSVTVKNTGTVAGKEAVLLFSSDLIASTAPDVKRLRRFTKIELQPDEAQVVKFELSVSDLSFINQANKRVTEPGEFVISVGNLKQAFRLK
jgi:beta-glucosidase